MVEDTRGTITTLLEKMKPVLVIAGVPEQQINMKKGRFRIDTCSKAFDWLHDLYMSREYTDVYDIWKLVPEETWKRYTAFGLEGLREQELIEERGKLLLKAWRDKRPKMFGPNKKDFELVDGGQLDTCRPE